ncbi:7953_t:CDS:2, partial [Racocetra persica]
GCFRSKWRVIVDIDMSEPHLPIISSLSQDLQTRVSSSSTSRYLKVFEEEFDCRSRHSVNRLDRK